jgi:hypothetical protein
MDGIAASRAATDSGRRPVIMTDNYTETTEAIEWEKFKQKHRGCSCCTPNKKEVDRIVKKFRGTESHKRNPLSISLKKLFFCK